MQQAINDLALTLINATTEQTIRLGSPEPAAGNYEVRVGAIVQSFTLSQ